MTLAEFEPDVWVPSSHAAARRGSISLEEIVSMDVIHGPRGRRGDLRRLDGGAARRGPAF